MGIGPSINGRFRLPMVGGGTDRGRVACKRRRGLRVQPFRASDTAYAIDYPLSPGLAVEVKRQRGLYPVPSVRVCALVVVGVIAFVVGAVNSVGGVPPMWAALLALAGAIMLTVGMLIYFRREAGRRP